MAILVDPALWPQPLNIGGEISLPHYMLRNNITPNGEIDCQAQALHHANLKQRDEAMVFFFIMTMRNDKAYRLFTCDNIEHIVLLLIRINNKMTRNHFTGDDYATR